MSNVHHDVKRKHKRRSRRGGKKVQARRLAALARETEATSAHAPAFQAAQFPANAKTFNKPEAIPISEDSKTETINIPIPPPSIEIIDTDTALKVQNHFDIPDNVLISLLRNFSNGIPK